MARVLVTGSAGFIGYHLSAALLAEGHEVIGLDGMTDYYDVALKRRRQQMLLQNERFRATETMLEDDAALSQAVSDARPDVIVHLAAQAGVRYSLKNPRSYIDSNLTGTFNLLEAAKAAGVGHLMMASTSSVYGVNEDLPFRETDKADLQVSLYAATKKANENMAHVYAHLWGLPVTMFRFFTVYGPWGRPDLALFKFVDAILAGQPIDVYNHGEMYRDFTYVGDLVRALVLLMDVPPEPPGGRASPIDGDSLSPVAPYRVVNVGNSNKVRLLDFIDAIEAELGIAAERRYLPMQPGDVPATWADASLLEALTGYRPETDLRDGIRAFVRWFRDYTGR